MSIASRSALPRTAHKELWSVERWGSYGKRCQSVRQRLGDLIAGFPATPGLKALDLNHLVTATHYLFRAMYAAENLFCRQHPGSDHMAMVTIHGSGGTFWVRVRGRVDKGTPQLNRAQWTELGELVKAIRSDVVKLLMEFQATRYATKTDVKRFLRVINAVDQAKCGFDRVLSFQHPDWPGFTHVFYGASDPIPTVK
jgi:hypothetical protein